MITVGDKFLAEAQRAGSKPTAVIGFVKAFLSAEAAYKSQWDAALSQTNIDTADPNYPNEVLIAKTLATAGVSQTTYNTNLYIQSGVVDNTLFSGPPPILVTSDNVFIYYQNFTIAQDSYLDKIKLLVSKIQYGASAPQSTLYIALMDGNNNVLEETISILSSAILNPSTWVEISFAAKNLKLYAGQTYKIYVTQSSAWAGGYVMSAFASSLNPYSGILQRSSNAPPPAETIADYDLAFEIVMFPRYQSTGSISVKLDVGSVPTNNGEWILEDVRDAGTTIDYHAWASATGAFTGEETDLGIIVDGDAITNLKRYYKITATLTTSSDKLTSPRIQKIKANFDVWDRYALKDSPLEFQGIPFPPIIMALPQLQYQMDLIEGKASISKISVNFLDEGFLEEAITGYYLKNNEIVIYIGFDADAWGFEDYIPFWRGSIVSWKRQTGLITLECSDWAQLAKKEIPVETAGGVVIPLTYDNSNTPHPMDIIIDILQNKINLRDSQIHTASFSDAKASSQLTGWKFRRTVSKPTDAWKLIQEIDQLAGCVMVPREDGKLYAYLFSPSSTHVAEFGNDQIKLGSVQFDARMDQTLINEAIIYYGFHAPYQLAGTATWTENSRALTGVGTAFAKELAVGDEVQGPDGRVYVVRDIQSDISLNLETVYGGATAAGATVVRPRTTDEEKPSSYEGAVAVTNATSIANYKQTLIRRILPSLWLGPDDGTYDGKTRATDVGTRIVNWSKNGIAFAKIITSLEFVNLQVGDLIRLGSRTTLPRNLLGFTWTKWVLASKTINFTDKTIAWDMWKVPAGAAFSDQLLAYSEWLNAASALLNVIISQWPTEVILNFIDEEKSDKLDTLAEWQAYQQQVNLLIEA